MTRLPILVAWITTAAVSVVAQVSPGTGLRILHPEHPRAFFFRAAEGAARRSDDFEAWAHEFSRLMGIEGKCLDEEIVGHFPKNAEFFRRFKSRYPDQLVMLHFNGNARDPRFEHGAYFPGHWIYRRATRILSDVPAEAGETEIVVEDVSDFRTGTGRYRTSNDDITLFRIGPDGRHDWNYFEHTQLLAVDVARKTIRVKRNCYGSAPRAFAAGAARAAAHQVEGPWGRANHLLWFYNFSAVGPRDAHGRSCADRLVEDFVRWFSPTGPLANFDGVEFDVLFHVTRGDTDGDGIEDDGVIGGTNQYGRGVLEFLRQLRERLGPQRLILADGALGPGGLRSQRGFHVLNGMESEGWPNLEDWEFRDWSGGWNRLRFWSQFGHPPAFSYVNHKWIEPVPGRPGETQAPSVPWSRHRLVFATAVLADAAICYSVMPVHSRGGAMPIWDELVGGTLQRAGWLGKPEGPVIQLARTESKNLWEGLDWSSRVTGPVRVERVQAGLRIIPTNATGEPVQFRVRDLPTAGTHLTVFATLSGQALPEYPVTAGRWVRVGVVHGIVELGSGPFDRVGILVRRGPTTGDGGLCGAVVRPGSRSDISDSGPAGSVILVHPPFQGAVGAVYWERTVEVPHGSELRFAVAMAASATQKSDGVVFAVEVAPWSTNELHWTRVFERHIRQARWEPVTIRMSRWDGQKVQMRFLADCGPKDHTVADRGYWRDVRLVVPGQVTDPEDFMTWIAQEPFEATFYFGRIGSRTVDLVVTLEGAEPVVIHALEAHPHPNAMARVFERGIVLANPSRQSYEFDLTKLSPGRRYRRLRATGGQDSTTNSGEPVGSRVLLGERDGLFLLYER